MQMLEMLMEGSRRLMLNNIKRLHYKPTALYQIILGTNGSGKSSVVNDATPLPADPKDYIKGGMKMTKWEHEGHEYVLTSTFKGSAKHSFLKNGVELNPGGTISVQKELVWQEFRITDMIHELITGQVLFSDMSTADRRKWLTMLSDTDFTFALNMFKKYSSSARDAQGTFKELSERLVNEQKKLKALGDTDEWAAEAEHLQKELEILFLSRSNRNLSGGEQRIAKMIDWECQMADRMLAMGNPIKGKFSSMEELNDRINTLDKEANLVKGLREWTTEALEDLHQLQKTVEGGGVESLEEAEAELVRLQATVDELQTHLVKWKEFGEADPRAMLNSIESVQEELSDVLRNIPNNSDKHFNKQTVQEARDSRLDFKKNVELFANRVAKEEATLEHIAGACKTECPQCSYAWLPGISVGRQQAAEDAVIEFRQKWQDATDNLQAVEKYLEEASEFSGYFMRFRALVSNNPSLELFWNAMLDVDAVNNDPKSWLAEFSGFSKDARVWLEIHTAMQRIDKLELTVDALRKSNGSEQLSVRIEQNNQKISALTEQMIELETSRGELVVMRQKAEQLVQMDVQLRQGYDKSQAAFDDYVVEMRDDSIAEVTRSYQSRLAFLNGKLNEKKTIQSLLEDMERFRSEVELKQKANKLIADILSPKDGFIAEQMSGFIAGFTEHLNAIIENVWTYQMEVQACGIESGELNYRFPVRIDGDPNGPDDVYRTSKGQKEMINFSFVLLVMFYLRLTNYPLYLDELGATFDETHRLNVMNFIKDLVESKGFSQVFMISHYASSHGAFTQAEVMVMDSSNISVPVKHNQHVTMV
jgi:ABC-type dipeptide/oligopeptide/nickel transport system ATPase component